MLLLSFFSLLLAILVFYKGYQWYTCLEYLLLATVYLFQLNISFSIFLSMKVLLSFLTFLFEIISIQKLQILNYLMKTWNNPCHAIIGIGNDVYHYSVSKAVADLSFHLIPSKHPLTTYQLRSKMFFAPCVGFSFTLTGDDGSEKCLQPCGKGQDWATVAITVLSCHKYLSYSCINLFRCFTMINFGSFIFLKVLDHNILKKLQRYFEIYLQKLIESGAPKELQESLTVHIIPLVEFAKIFLHVALIVFHMGLVAFDIVNLKEERLEDTDEVAKKCFKLHGFYIETVKLILLIALAYSWHFHVPSAVMEYDFLVYVLTCLIVGRIVNFIVSRKFEEMKNN